MTTPKRSTPKNEVEEAPPVDGGNVTDVGILAPNEDVSDKSFDGTHSIVATSNETVTLPSGASYSLRPGQRMSLRAEDAKSLINSGLASEA